MRKKIVSVLAVIIALQAIGIVIMGKPALPFEDVSYKAWYRDAVAYVYENNLLKGTSETMFSPNLPMTRGMIVTALYRLDGSPEVSMKNPFVDVNEDQGYVEAVLWASSMGIANGAGNNLFLPEEQVTREQIAVFLFRYAAGKGADVTAQADLSVYEDSDQVSAYAKDAMAWAVACHIAEGDADNKLNPEAVATRVDAAVMLMQLSLYMEKQVGSDSGLNGYTEIQNDLKGDFL